MVKALVSLSTGGGYLQGGQSLRYSVIFPIESACNLVIPPICRDLDFVIPPLHFVFILFNPKSGGKISRHSNFIDIHD